MNNDLKSLRADMSAQKPPEPVAGLLAFAFGLVLVGVIVGMIWAVFEPPAAPRGAPVIADAAVTAPVVAEPEPEVVPELVGGDLAGADADTPGINLPTGEMRDANLRLYINTVDHLETCSKSAGANNFITVRDSYIRTNRGAYEAWMNTRVADLPLIRRNGAVESNDQKFEDIVDAVQLQARANTVVHREYGSTLTANDCAQLRAEVQSGVRDVKRPPSA